MSVSVLHSFPALNHTKVHLHSNHSPVVIVYPLKLSCDCKETFHLHRLLEKLHVRATRLEVAQRRIHEEAK